jgi:integrase
MSQTAVSVPKYRRHKGSGQAFVQVQGRRHYIGRWGSPASKERYARFVAELAVKPAAAVPTTPTTPAPEITVVELCAAYLDFAEVYYRKDEAPTRSIEEARTAVRILRDLYGRTAVNEFGPLRLLAIQEKLARGDHARSYVNKLIGYIKRVFKWGVSRQLIPAGVFHALATVEGLKRGRTTAREPAPIKPVDASVVDATLPHLPVVVADMVRLQRLTGCRPGEVCQLRPCDLDRSGEVWQYRPASHKTQHHGRERVIFIGPQAQALLLAYLLRPTYAYCFSPAESVKKHQSELRARRKTRVQPSQQDRRKRSPKKVPGDHYTRHAYCQAIARGIRNANRQRTKDAAAADCEPELLVRWHANQLRHSAATEIRRVYGLEAAQVILGHAKADVTQVYAERDHALAAEVMKRIG